MSSCDRDDFARRGGDGQARSTALEVQDPGRRTRPDELPQLLLRMVPTYGDSMCVALLTRLGSSSWSGCVRRDGPGGVALDAGARSGSGRWPRSCVTFPDVAGLAVCTGLCATSSSATPPTIRRKPSARRRVLGRDYCSGWGDWPTERKCPQRLSLSGEAANSFYQRVAFVGSILTRARIGPTTVAVWPTPRSIRLRTSAQHATSGMPPEWAMTPGGRRSSQ